MATVGFKGLITLETGQLCKDLTETGRNLEEERRPVQTLVI